MKEGWKEICVKKRQALHDSIPATWLIPRLPIRDHPNVMDIPATSGVLSKKELEITDEVDIHVILEKLKTKEWGSVEVTTAFYKRAIIAHQTVRQIRHLLLMFFIFMFARQTA